MSQYFRKSNYCLSGNKKVEPDLPNYTTKPAADLITLKSRIDELEIAKLQTFTTELNNLNFDVVQKTLYNKFAPKGIGTETN